MVVSRRRREGICRGWPLAQAQWSHPPPLFITGIGGLGAGRRGGEPGFTAKGGVQKKIKILAVIDHEEMRPWSESRAIHA